MLIMPPPPSPHPRTMLLCNPVKEQAGLQQLSGCAYHAPPVNPPQSHVTLQSGKRAVWSAAVERVCLSCPTPPKPSPRAMLLCNPVKEQAGLQQLGGPPTQPPPPPPKTMLFCNPVKEQAGLQQLGGCAYHAPPQPPPPRDQ